MLIIFCFRVRDVTHDVTVRTTTRRDVAATVKYYANDAAGGSKFVQICSSFCNILFYFILLQHLFHSIYIVSVMLWMADGQDVESALVQHDNVVSVHRHRPLQLHLRMGRRHLRDALSCISEKYSAT